MESNAHEIKLKDEGRQIMEHSPRISDPDLCAIKIIVGPEKEVIHTQDALLWRVPFFLKEPSTREFLMPDLSVIGVNNVLDFLWHGFLERSASNEDIVQIALAGSAFGLDELKAQCVKILEKQLTSMNYNEIKEIGIRISSANLLRKVEDYCLSADKNKMLSQSEDLINLDLGKLERAIRSCTEKENQGKVLTAIVKWVESNQEERKCFLSKLVKLVNLEDVLNYSRDVYKQEFRVGSLLSNDLECLKISQSTLLAHVPQRDNEKSSCKPNEIHGATGDCIYDAETESLDDTDSIGNVQVQSVSASTSSKKKRPSSRKASTRCSDIGTRAKRIMLTPGSKATGDLRSETSPKEYLTGSDQILHQMQIMYPNKTRAKLKIYDFQEKSTNIAHVLTSPRKLASLLVTPLNVYHGGGSTRNSNRGSRIVEAFTRNSQSASTFPKFLEFRKEFGMCLLENKLFAIGGCQNNAAMDCTEVLDLNKNQSTWQQIKYLSNPRGALDIAGLHDKIYAVGGVGIIGGSGNSGKPEFANSMNVVEVYDPRANKWSHVVNLIENRGYLKVGEIDGILYAVGGMNETDTQLNTMEKLDIRMRNWMPAAKLNSQRSSHGLIVSNGYLYAIGGNVGQKSMEYYDPRADRWNLLTWPEGLDKDGDFLSVALVPHG